MALLRWSWVLVWMSLCISLTAAWSHISEAGLREALQSNSHTLVAFVRPLQEASKNLENEWLATQKAETEGTVLSVDCSANAAVCQEYDAVSYPAIRLYLEDGTFFRYRGPRNKASIVSFLRRALRPVMSTISDQNITAFASVDDVVFVAYLLPSDKSLKRRYSTIAKQYHDQFSFGVSFKARVPQSTISCYNNPDNMQHTVQADELFKVEELGKFVEKCSLPLIPELTRRNEAHYTSTGKSLLHYFVGSDKERETYIKEVHDLAKHYAEYLIFATTDANQYPEMLETVGFKKGKAGVLLLENPTNGDLFVYRGRQKIKASVVDQFINEVVDGKVEAWNRQRPQVRSQKHEEL